MARLLFFLLLAACKSEPGESVGSDMELRVIVNDWNAAMNDKNTVKLESIYGGSVRYYGATVTKTECIAKIAAVFKKEPEYHQELTLPEVHRRDASHADMSFVKTTSLGPQVHVGRLGFERQGKEWKIIEEE